MEKQKNIQLGEVLLPEIKHKKITYYPLSYVIEKVLLKKGQSLSKLKENGYGDYIEKLSVNYNFNKSETQTTNCISREGLIKMLENSNIGGLSVNQRKSMNLLLDYLNLDTVSEKPRFVNTYNYANSGKYDEFEVDCIEGALKISPNIKWQRCKECGKYYPLSTNFFVLNSRDKVYRTYCKNCKNTDARHRVSHSNNQLNNIYHLYGNELYIHYKNHDTIKIYKHYMLNNLKHMPKILNNKEDYMLIIKHLYNNSKISKDDLNFKVLIEKYRLNSIKSYFTVGDIYSSLFGSHPREYPWKYKSFSLSSPSPNEVKNIFSNYLSDNNICINDAYNFNYYSVVISSGLAKHYGNDILKFIMEFHENKYPAYKFNIASVNYWKDKDNRNMALKYLIEKDMEIEIEKIPLYLTFTSLRNIGTSTMYNVLKKYYNGIYEWVNDVYPNIFDPKDFDINYMRNEFDSVEEQMIHDILKKNFQNVIYNSRNADCTIELMGKFPDWFIFTEKGCIIVEYFGLWDKRRESYNSRTKNYVVSSKDKINKYKTLSGYKFLYIHPEDIVNNFEGLNNKMKEFL